MQRTPGQYLPLAPVWWREVVESLARTPSLAGYPVDDVQRLARELATVLETRGWELRRIGSVG